MHSRATQAHVELAMNNSVNATTGMTPTELPDGFRIGKAPPLISMINHQRPLLASFPEHNSYLTSRETHSAHHTMKETHKPYACIRPKCSDRFLKVKQRDDHFKNDTIRQVQQNANDVAVAS